MTGKIAEDSPDREVAGDGRPPLWGQYPTSRPADAKIGDMQNDEEIRDLLRKMYKLQQEQFAEYRRVTALIVRILILAGVLFVSAGTIMVGMVIYRMSHPEPGQQQR